jgi:VanZ family protein
MNHSITSGSPVPSRILRYWIPVLVMLGAMYYFSTDVFSGENTRSMIEVILGWFGQHPNSHSLYKINHAVRKCAHFLEYAILAVLVFRAFRADSPLRWKLAWFLYSLAIVVCWSLLDEYHQHFTHSRGASIYDSMLDTSGGLTALVVIALIGRIRRRAPPY